MCTDIARDGTLQGPNVQLYQTCVERYPEISFQASGGVHSLQDIHDLKMIRVAGIIIGKALYDRRFSLRAAIHEANLC